MCSTKLTGYEVAGVINTLMSHSGGHALMTPASHKCLSAPKYFSCVSLSRLANQSAEAKPAPGTARASTTACGHVASATAVVELQPHLSCKRLANFQLSLLVLEQLFSTCMQCTAIATAVYVLQCILKSKLYLLSTM
jgi:hypothetical protein